MGFIPDPGEEPPPGYEPPPPEPPPVIIILPPGALDPGGPGYDVGGIQPGSILDLRTGQLSRYDGDVAKAYQAYLDSQGTFNAYTTEAPLIVDAGLAAVAQETRLLAALERRIAQIEAYLA